MNIKQRIAPLFLVAATASGTYAVHANERPDNEKPVQEKVIQLVRGDDGKKRLELDPRALDDVRSILRTDAPDAPEAEPVIPHRTNE